MIHSSLIPHTACFSSLAACLAGSFTFIGQVSPSIHSCLKGTVSGNALKTYGGAEVHLHYFSISAIVGQLHTPPAFSPGKLLPVATEYEAGWAPEPVWAVWRREKSVALQKLNI